tara:strand:+ start:214 stop:624 length:411 start_codon:yes stop_codon:yes gene_type:complete
MVFQPTSRIHNSAFSATLAPEAGSASGSEQILTTLHPMQVIYINVKQMLSFLGELGKGKRLAGDGGSRNARGVSGKGIGVVSGRGEGKEYDMRVYCCCFCCCCCCLMWVIMMVMMMANKKGEKREQIYMVSILSFG